MKEIRTWLLQEADTRVKEFASSLIPNCGAMLGVRLPKLRQKAKELAKGNWQEFVARNDCEYMEELLLQGMVIGSVKLPVEEHLALVRDYIPKITNWSLCDCFCCSLKFTQKNREVVWDFLKPYLASQDEFELRFGVVMLLDFFVTEEWIDKVLDILFALDSEDYYAQMGIAWAISVCAAKFFDKTYKKLSSCSLPSVILKKSIQKSCVSFRLTKEQKILMKKALL